MAPAAASAQNVGTLDAQAATPGHVGKVDPHPFTASVLRTFTASSKHTISARAFISEKHGRHASRTLRVSFLACS